MNRDHPEGMRRRLRLGAEHETWMMMSVALSLCVLLVIAMLVLPVFGVRVAAVTAVTAVLGIVILCYFVCVTRVATRRDVHDELPEDPPGDRLLAVLLILAAGAFTLMLVWLVGR